MFLATISCISVFPAHKTLEWRRERAVSLLSSADNLKRSTPIRAVHPR
jgi:hypothetical protein